MENHNDDSETNVKVSDSAYSNSCSNSQSRRSNSSKSTHSGSNSSGSSGYGGKKPSSTSDGSNTLNQPPEKRLKDKEPKKKKSNQLDPLLVTESPTNIDIKPSEDIEKEEVKIPEISEEYVVGTTSALARHDLQEPESMDIVATQDQAISNDETILANIPLVTSQSVQYITRPSSTNIDFDGFSCVISMHDGVVMYTTPSLTNTLGYPKDMWIGRSFIDFIHPQDRSTFASQITNGLVSPKNETRFHQERALYQSNPVSTLFCRIRKYRGLMTSGFGVKDAPVKYMPFHLKLSFKNINDDDGKTIYLVMLATPCFSAFKTPYEVITNMMPFTIRHIANGNFEYLDPESVPYLGYLPQDLADKSVLQLYHPEDLCYMKHVYETIVKEGGMSRSKSFRLMAQNGHYVKMESEWSSFINPWSRKLEFVIGKIHVIEGPKNPDVFQSHDKDTASLSEEALVNAQPQRESIVKIMNEVLTKPAEVAKQQMSKKCENIASFMESLIEDEIKTGDVYRKDITEQDHSYYERDSVMLGGISPHHDNDDSKSSTATPVTYNQLNYNENMQRYFDCHQPYSFVREISNAELVVNAYAIEDQVVTDSKCLSPVAQPCRDSGDATSSGDSSAFVTLETSPRTSFSDYMPIRLTASLLNKHNMDMEKQLIKRHRETRPNSRGEKEKMNCEKRQKKKEHLARCNASYQPTHVQEPHGVKRRSRHFHPDGCSGKKHHKPTPRQLRRRHKNIVPPTSQPVNVSSTSTSTTSCWHIHSTSYTNQQNINVPTSMGMHSTGGMMPMNSVPTVLGMIPMYYVPPSNQMGDTPTPTENTNNHQTPVPYMMYSHAMFGSPFMYPQVPFGTITASNSSTVRNSQHVKPSAVVGLTSRNYEEVCKFTLPNKAVRPHANANHTNTNWREKKSRNESNQMQPSASKADLNNVIMPSTNALNRSTEAVPNLSLEKLKTKSGTEETIDRTDEESSYSSFYSSFLKTAESGSAEDSSDTRNKDFGVEPGKTKEWDRTRGGVISGDNQTTSIHQVKKVAKRKMEPPWMDQVYVTSELIYKYQINSREKDDVLTQDKKRMDFLEQPDLVNEQLGQLYMDLQLAGVASRLTLEEGNSSTESTDDEACSAPKIKITKEAARRWEYSKMSMVYQEDAPLPSP